MFGIRKQGCSWLFTQARCAILSTTTPPPPRPSSPVPFPAARDGDAVDRYYRPVSIMRHCLPSTASCVDEIQKCARDLSLDVCYLASLPKAAGL